MKFYATNLMRSCVITNKLYMYQLRCNFVLNDNVRLRFDEVSPVDLMHPEHACYCVERATTYVHTTSGSFGALPCVPNNSLLFPPRVLCV